jgi:hypothetical protein
MTAETIHTCSYECERPACIRAQRDELASRLGAETSNARGEWPERYACNGPEGTFWTDDAALANKLIAAALDRDEWTVTDTQNPTAVAPPPAAARGDVRGLVAKWRNESESEHHLAYKLRESGDRDVADLRLGYATVLHNCANELESALAAEGVQAGEVEQQPEARGVVGSAYMKRLWLDEWMSDHDVELASDAYDDLLAALTGERNG